MLWKDDGVLRTDAAASRTTALAVVLILDQDPLLVVDPVYAEEAKINALQTVRAPAVINDRVPSIYHRFSQHDRTSAFLLRRRKPLEQVRLRVALVRIWPQPSEQDELDQDLFNDSLDLFYVHASVIVSAKIETVDITVEDFYQTDSSMFLFIGAARLFIVLFAHAFQQRDTLFPADPIPIQQPVRSPRILPREKDQVALHGVEVKQARVAGRKVVDVRRHGKLDPRFEQQGRGDFFFETPFAGVLASRL